MFPLVKLFYFKTDVSAFISVVKGISEVELNNSLVWGEVVEIVSGSMDCSINTSFDTEAQLAGGQEGHHLGPYSAESSFCNKTTEGRTHCNRPNPFPFLSRAIKDAPKKAGRIEDGVRPSRTKLVKEVRAIKR